MQIALAQLSAQLQRGLAPLYLLHGDEALLIEEAADAVRAAARAAGHTERTVFVASGAHFDWSAVLAAGGSLSLFADRQTVEMRVSLRASPARRAAWRCSNWPQRRAGQRQHAHPGA
jgi:DNA polymerase-3 subunit delta